jgi:hypothetical protein
MHIKWIKRHIPRLKNKLIFLSSKGPVVWDDVGSVVDCEPVVGVEVLTKHPDIMEEVPAPEPETKKRGVRRSKRMDTPSDKMARISEDK